MSVKKTISTILINTVDMFLTTIKQTSIKTFLVLTDINILIIHD